MQRTITTITAKTMVAVKNEKGEFISEFSDVTLIANTATEFDKAFKNQSIKGVVIEYGEPQTALYKLDDNEFLRLATKIEKSENVDENGENGDEKTAE